MFDYVVLQLAEGRLAGFRVDDLGSVLTFVLTLVAVLLLFRRLEQRSRVFWRVAPPSGAPTRASVGLDLDLDASIGLAGLLYAVGAFDRVELEVMGLKGWRKTLLFRDLLRTSWFWRDHVGVIWGPLLRGGAAFGVAYDVYGAAWIGCALRWERPRDG